MAGPAKVLMVCYFFPPILTSGTSRSIRFAADLVSKGYEVTVLTVKHSKDTWINYDGSATPEGVRIVRSREFNLNGAIRFAFGLFNKPFKILGIPFKRNHFLEYLCIPDPHIAWRCLFRGITEAKKADLLYVSCAPFSAALKSALIKTFTGKPLVLDFRDPWTINQYRYTPKLRKPVEKALEKMVLKKADCLILNTPGTVDYYKTHFSGLEDKLVYIPNGYEKILEAKPEREKGPFTIVHTGSFYGSRSPINLLQALVELDNPDIEFIHAGVDSEEFPNFEGKVKMTNLGMLPKAEALDLCRKADLLYLRQGHEEHIDRYVAVGAKTYDYLSTGLPILAECPKGDNSDIIAKHANKSWIINEDSNVEAIKRAISEAYSQKDQRKVAVKKSFREEFSREVLILKLEDVFKKVLNQ